MYSVSGCVSTVEWQRKKQSEGWSKCACVYVVVYDVVPHLIVSLSVLGGEIE